MADTLSKFQNIIRQNYLVQQDALAQMWSWRIVYGSHKHKDTPPIGEYIQMLFFGNMNK